MSRPAESPSVRGGAPNNVTNKPSGSDPLEDVVDAVRAEIAALEAELASAVA
jgi:hypothetical protein